MIVKYFYKDKELSINIPSNRILDVIQAKKTDKKDERKIIEQAVQIDEFLETGKILFLINDHTRPTPTWKILDVISDKIDRNPNISFLVATGSHRKPTEEELKKIFGQNFIKWRNRIFIHQSKVDEELKYIFTTSRGTEVFINKRVLDADKIVIINSVEPHYFAGFTGGRKSFLPGVSGYNTITQNHKMALDKNSATLSLKGNPVHEDMNEIAHRIMDEFNKKIYHISLVLDAENNIYHVSAGDLDEAFYSSIEACQKLFCVNIEKKADIVVAITDPPFDIDLYQSHKAIENAKLALKEGGILILVSECRDGIGPPEFYQLLKEQNNPEDVIQHVKENYVLGYHKSAKLADLVSWAKIYAVTGLDKKIIRDCFMESFDSLDAALNRALQEKEGKVLFFTRSATTVPIIKG